MRSFPYTGLSDISYIASYSGNKVLALPVCPPKVEVTGSKPVGDHSHTLLAAPLEGQRDVSGTGSPAACLSAWKIASKYWRSPGYPTFARIRAAPRIGVGGTGGGCRKFLLGPIPNNLRAAQDSLERLAPQPMGDEATHLTPGEVRRIIGRAAARFSVAGDAQHPASGGRRIAASRLGVERLQRAGASRRGRRSREDSPHETRPRAPGHPRAPARHNGRVISFDRVIAQCRIGARGLGDLLREEGVREGGN